jgi:hypothetical protein
MGRGFFAAAGASVAHSLIGRVLLLSMIFLSCKRPDVHAFVGLTPTVMPSSTRIVEGRMDSLRKIRRSALGGLDDDGNRMRIRRDLAQKSLSNRKLQQLIDLEARRQSSSSSTRRLAESQLQFARTVLAFVAIAAALLLAPLSLQSGLVSTMKSVGSIPLPSFLSTAAGAVSKNPTLINLGADLGESRVALVVVASLVGAPIVERSAHWLEVELARLRLRS